MKDKTIDDLNEVIAERIEETRNLKNGSEEKAKAIEELTAIHKLKIEEAKVRQTTLNQIMSIGMQGVTVVGGWIFYNLILRKEQYFEINNTPRTQTYRNLLSRVFPKF